MEFPIYESQIPVPRPPAPIVPEAEEGEAMAAFGRAFTQAGTVILGKLFENEQTTQANKALTEAERRFQLWYFDRETDDDYLTFNQRFQEFRQKTKDEIMDTVKIPGARRRLEPLFERTANETEMKTLNLARLKSVDAGLAQGNQRILQAVQARNLDELGRTLGEMHQNDLINESEYAGALEKNSTLIRQGMAEDRARTYGDGAADFLLDPKSEQQFGLTHDQLLGVVAKLETEKNLIKGIQDKQQREAADRDFWQAYKDIESDALTDITKLDDAIVYPGLQPPQFGDWKIKLHAYMQAKANAGAAQANAVLDTEESTTASNLWTRLANVKMGGKDDTLAQDIGGFTSQFPMYDTDVKQLVQEYASIQAGAAQDLEKSLLTAQASSLFARRGLTLDWIEQVATKYQDRKWMGEWKEHWIMKLDDQANVFKADRERSLYEVTDPAIEMQYISKLVGPETTEEIQGWLKQTWAPGKIGNTDFKKWYAEVDSWKKDPDWLKETLAGMGAKYDEMIKLERDPKRKGEYVQEKLRTLRQFREEVTKRDLGQKELDALRLNIEDPVKARTGDAKVRRALQHYLPMIAKPPEEQLVDWARQGRLSSTGRLIGFTDEDQLAMMGIQSFADLDWKTSSNERRALEKYGIRVEDILNAPPSDQIDVLTVQKTLLPYEILAYDQAGNWVVFNQLNGTRRPAIVKKTPQHLPK